MKNLLCIKVQGLPRLGLGVLSHGNQSECPGCLKFSYLSKYNRPELIRVERRSIEPLQVCGGARLIRAIHAVLVPQPQPHVVAIVPAEPWKQKTLNTLQCNYSYLLSLTGHSLDMLELLEAVEDWER